MRHLATLMALCFLFTGCATNLPYALSLDELGGTSGCAVSLLDVVDGVLNETGIKELDSVKGKWTIASVQEEFEGKLSAEVQSLQKSNKACPQDEDFRHRLAKHTVQSVSSKWITAFAIEPTDPDQSMERFEEFLVSMGLIKMFLEEKSIRADLSTDKSAKIDFEDWSEKRRDHRAQWFGDRDPSGGCLRCDVLQNVTQNMRLLFKEETVGPDCPRCSLYKVITWPKDNLYPSGRSLRTGMLLEHTRQIINDKDRMARIVALSYSIPWDSEGTLIRYSVTFYFKDRNNVTLGSGHVTSFLGYDLVYANEATPAPLTSSEERPPQPSTYSLRSLWDATGYPFSMVIGIKNAAFELAKLPFSLAAGGLFGRDHFWNYLGQVGSNFKDAILFEFSLSNLPRGGMITGIQRLLGEVPVIGHIYNYPIPLFGPDKSDSSRKKLFLSRGIYGGNKWGQDTGLWAAMAHHAYPDFDVYSPPYRHGTITDVVWSMFNLSHGPAYNEARYIMQHARPGDQIYLAGHSGGVQRSATTSRLLYYHGYEVKKVMGIAGPSIGKAFVDDRYPDPFRVYLNSQGGANRDVVSQVAAVAGLFSSIIDFALVTPTTYIWRVLCPLPECTEFADQSIKQQSISNAKLIEVERKASSQHQTPLRLSLGNPVVFDAFLRNEFTTVFRDDLERPQPKLILPGLGTSEAFRWNKP